MLAIIPFVVFGVWWIKDYLGGGYKAVKLNQPGSGREKSARAA